MQENGTPLKDKIAPSRILEKIPASKIKQDLERYRKMAIALGAEDATIVSTDDIIIDERVRAKCIYPKCGFYGSNLNCPPHAADLDFMRKVVARYHHAVLFSVKDKTGDFLGTGFRRLTGKQNPSKITLNTICSEIESRAFYDGYHLALAFGQGPCKSFWCADKPCAGLHEDGVCRFAYKARSSMEAVGIDVFAMVARTGWEIYPCGARVDPEKTPHVLLVGLILID